MAARRFALAAALLAASIAWALPTDSALSFVPDGVLNSSHIAAYEQAVMAVQHRLAVVVTYNRHGGAHRMADRPMGGVLVRPPEERRVRTVEGFRAHLDEAATLPFPPDVRLRSSALSPDILLAVRKSVALRGSLGGFRRSVISFISETAEYVRPISKIVADRLMPPSVHWISGHVNVAFMAVIVDALRWLDRSIVRGFVYGFQVVGDIPDSLVYRPIQPSDASAFATRLEQFVETAPAWNRAQSGRLQQHRTALPSQRLADAGVAKKTREELGKGAVRGPYPSVAGLAAAVARAYPSSAAPRSPFTGPGCPAGTVPRPLTRFGIVQKGKVRCIDDGRSNGANGATRMHETVTTPTFFFVALVARAVHDAATAAGHPVPELIIALADLAMAYRTVPNASPQYTSFAFYNPGTRRVEYYYIPGLPFGLVSSVVTFNRFPELVVVAARALAAVPVDHYFDDFIVTDLAAAGDTGLHVVEALVQGLGRGGPRAAGARIRAPELDPKKTQWSRAHNIVLGVNASVAYLTDLGEVLFSTTEDRVREILATFRACFRRGEMRPQEASKLRGKTYFALVPAYGCVGRAATLPLVQRQYRDTSSLFLEGSELHHTMLFFEALLPHLPPLVVSVAPPSAPALLVYTDASFHLKRVRKRISGECDEPRHRRLGGGLGAVIYDPVDGVVRYASGKPDWAVLLKFWPSDRKTYIAQLEMLAAISVYFTYPELFAGRRVNHFIDNTVALSALVHGYSGKRDLAKMVNAFYLQMAGLRAHVYFDYVPSKANPADLPSRDAERELLLELAGLRIASTESHELRTPGLAEWQAPLDAWIRRNLHLEADWPM